MRVAHLAVDHPPFSSRIFHRECVSMARGGHEVHLLVPNAPDGERSGVQFHRLEPPPEGRRLRRLWRLWRYVYRRSRAVGADVYHIHEPKLIPIGLALKRAGAKVVYDVHEDTPREMMAFVAGSPWRARARFVIWNIVEWLAQRSFDGFVCATETIARRFPDGRTIVVHNYPESRETTALEAHWEPPAYHTRLNTIVYIGGLTRVRGVAEMVDAIDLVPAAFDARLILYGAFDSDELAAATATRAGWHRVEWLGWRPHEQVMAALYRARVGLVVLHPLDIHVDSMPTKLFEYMSAGLPVISSDFPAWRTIVDEHQCGLLVDPRDPSAISDAIRTILEDPTEAAKMGERGRVAVRQRYSWQSESGKLLAFYESLSDGA